ncbi:MAG TPA: hypothetical protein DDW55_05625 [Gammaproteobacteria bacterium]|nr:hypothetical protein [Gammaproteobacteria bacterium]
MPDVLTPKQRHQAMSHNRGRTKPERVLASALWRNGIRFFTTPGYRSLPERTQRITISSIHSPCMLFMRRSGSFLRHTLTVAPLLSLNGTVGISSFCRLSPNWNRLFFIIIALRLSWCVYTGNFTNISTWTA